LIKDGYVRIWNTDIIKNAEVLNDENSTQGALSARIFELEPVDEILVGKDIKIKGILYSSSLGTYVIQCGNGTLYKLDLQHSIVEPIFKFPAGSLMTVANTSVPGVISLGDDGTLRLYNNHDRKVVAEKTYATSGTVLKYLNEETDPQACTFVAGFLDGTVRIISHDYINTKSAKFYLMSVFKAHSEAVNGIYTNQSAEYLITTSADKTLFIFKTLFSKTSKRNMAGSELKVIPIGFIHVKSKIQYITFLDKTNENSVCILVLYKSGVLETVVVDITDWITDDTFELPASRHTHESFRVLTFSDLTKQDTDMEKVSESLKINGQCIISNMIQVNEKASLVCIVNSENSTEIRLVQSNDSSCSQ